MNDQDYNQPAFPIPYNEHLNNQPNAGLTMLDHFAGQALAAYLNHPENQMRSKVNAVHNAYDIAAAMMEERKKYLNK